jgi:hypothetical protein
MHIQLRFLWYTFWLPRRNLNIYAPEVGTSYRLDDLEHHVVASALLLQQYRLLGLRSTH